VSRYEFLRRLTGLAIDEAMRADSVAGSRPWENESLKQNQPGVPDWVERPETIDPKIRASLKLFASLLEPGQRVLDVGCFAGYCSDWLRANRPGLRYFGVDVSPAAVALAKRLHPTREHDFHEGDLFRLESTVEAHGPFDAALCLRVVIHCPSLYQALHELTDAAPIVVVGLRVGEEDTAVEMLDTVSGERVFHRTYCPRTIAASMPLGFDWDLVHGPERFRGSDYSSLVLRERRA